MLFLVALDVSQYAKRMGEIRDPEKKADSGVGRVFCGRKKREWPQAGSSPSESRSPWSKKLLLNLKSSGNFSLDYRVHSWTTSYPWRVLELR